VELKYLDNQLRKYTGKLSITHAISIYGSDLAGLNATLLKELTIPVDTGKFDTIYGQLGSISRVHSSKKLVPYLAQLYFLDQNGPPVLMKGMEDQIVDYEVFSVETALSNKNYVNFVAFISIGVIFIVGIIIIPLIVKVEAQKLKVLEYFNLLANADYLELASKALQF